MKKIFAILLMVSIGVGFLSAQKATPYQKKYLQIMKKYAAKGYSQSQMQEIEQGLWILTMGAESQYDEYEIRIAAYGTYALSLCVYDSRLKASMEKELKAAEKLKNATDRKKEKEAKDKKERKEREKKEIEERKEKERKEQERIRLQKAYLTVKDMLDIAEKDYVSDVDGLLTSKGWRYDFNNKWSFNESSSVCWYKDSLGDGHFLFVCRQFVTYSEDYSKKESDSGDCPFETDFEKNGFSLDENAEDIYLNKIDFGDWGINGEVHVYKNPKFTIEYEVFPGSSGNVKMYETIFDIHNHLKKQERAEQRAMFAKYGDSLQQAVNQVKTELSEFPYNINKLTLEGDYTLSRSNFGNEAALKEELRKKTTEIQEKTVALKSLIVKELRTNSPEKYLQIWFKQNPGKRAEAEKLWPECRCKYAGEQDFQLAFTDDTVSDCGCRADLYDKYGNLFKNKHEFDKYYDKGQSEINHEIEERTAVKKELSAFETYMKTAKQVKLKEALTSKKDAVQLVVSKLQYFKNNYFYEEAVQILFTYNEKLAKEWKENGQYFESQVEMYEAYIGEEYKAILKGKKQ